MADRKTDKAGLTRDNAIELIPWYVNGTLSDAEAVEIEAYAEQFPDIQAEIDHQSEIAAGLCMLDVPEADGARQAQSWQTLSARIAQESHVRAPIARSASWFPQFRRIPAVVGTLAAFALVAVYFGSPEDPEFRTLTSGDPELNPVIVFQLSPGVAPADVDAILAQHGMALVGEPTENGVFRVNVPKGETPEDFAKSLMATPEIAFAAPEGTE